MIFGAVLSLFLIYVLGYLLSLLITKKSTLPFRLLLSFGLGTGAISLIMSILGILYNFKTETFLTVYSALVLALLYANRKNIRMPQSGIFEVWSGFRSVVRHGVRSAIKPATSASALALAIIAVFVVTSSFHIIYFPDLYYDAPLYANWAKILYNDKRINFVEGGPTISLGPASNYPSAYQMLSVFVYFFTGESMEPVRLVSMVTALSMSLLTYHWSKEIFKSKALAFFSLLIFISLPFTIFFSRSSSQYMYITFQFSLACYFLQRFLLGKDKKNLYVSAIFGGFVASASYLGLSFIPILLLALQTERKFYKNILVALLLFFLVASPWYLKNLVVLGNPLWPFGGGRYIDPNIQANSFNQLNAMSKMSGFNYDTLDDLKSSLSRLFFSYVDPADAAFYQGVNPFFTLLAIPAIFIWIRKRHDKEHKKIEFFVFWFLISLAFYIVTSSYWNRYLITMSIPTVFLSVYLINSLVEKSRGFGSPGRLARSGLVLLLGILYLFSIYLSLFWTECHVGSMGQVLENLGEHERILEICYGKDFRLWTWVNENLPKNAKIATTDFIRLYYYDRPVLEFNSWWLRGLQYSSSIEESVEVLRGNGVEYLAITGGMEEFKKYPQHFELIEEMDGSAVYKII